MTDGHSDQELDQKASSPTGDTIVNFEDRPINDRELDIKTKEIEDRNLNRDHRRKYTALIFVMAGFFASSLLDMYLSFDNKSMWVTDLFTKTIVPILAFVLGAHINRD